MPKKLCTKEGESTKRGEKIYNDSCDLYPSTNVTWCVQFLRSPKEAFAAAMQSWRERCEKCVCLQGDYV